MTAEPNRASVQEPKASIARRKNPGGQFALMFLLLLALLGFLMRRSFDPDRVLFSNDGPLGRLVSECHHLPEAFTGTWEDLNAVGYREQGALPNITCGLRLLLKPLWFSKLYAPIALLILGLCAWYFFRQVGLSPPACILGGLATTLNSSFFSTACWGVAGHVLALAMTFLALAALVNTSTWRGWLRAALAGMAVGMALAEGADMGAILSLCVAAFVLYQAWTSPGSRDRNLAQGASRLGVVIIFAVFLAAYSISALVETQVQGMSGMQQDFQTREERWNWATQWSLPKTETLSLVVPGLFGYRMDSPDGGGYWGSIGRNVEWARYIADGRYGPKPNGFVRQTGGGIYAGITVVLIAVWAAVQSLRRRDSTFGPGQRRWLRFWMWLGVISLVLGFGHYAPFYRLLYALPFSSTIRNPVKFLALVNLALVILFAFGVDGLWQKYMATTKAGLSSPQAALKNWWATPGAEKNWIGGCLLVLAASLIGWGLYAKAHEPMVQYLRSVAFKELAAETIHWFSVSQVGWFTLFLLLAVVMVTLIFSGVFSGLRARRGVMLLGLLLVLDLGRANLPWIVYWNYKEKYAANPVVDFLRQKPFEQRVILMPFQGLPEYAKLSRLYLVEWAQHLFQYYEIQSSEIVQMSRVPKDMQAFNEAVYYDGTLPMIYRLFRNWELTNTRYMVGIAQAADTINQKFDPARQRFHILFRFKIVDRGVAAGQGEVDNLTAELAPDGEYALYEFTGALPRAKLYSSWQVSNDDQATLNQLASPAFEPMHTLFVSGNVPPGTNSTNSDAGQNAGTVEIASYTSREVRLKANATAPAVLLLNDKFDPAWQVSVDGQPAPMLHCNYLMRGVYLQPGAHAIEFSFHPRAGLLRVSLAAIGVTVLLLAVLMVAGFVFPVPAPITTSVPPAPPAPQPVANVSTKAKRRASRSKT